VRFKQEAIPCAVVGVGHLGSLHARYLAELEGAELLGVYDLVPERMEAVCGKTGCRAFKSLEEVIAARPAFVVVATDTGAHASVAQALVEENIAVLVEKPLTRTLEEADRLLQVADSKPGSFLGVGHVERFNPVVQAARAHVHDPLFIECDRVHPFPFRSMDIGVVLDIMIHDVDLVLWLAGAEVAGVEAIGASVLSPNEDMAYARLSFENGCVAVVRASRVSLRKVRKLRVFCPDLYVSLDYLSLRGTTIQLKPGAREEVSRQLAEGTLPPAGFLQYLEVQNLTVQQDQPLRAELAAFLDALRAGRQPPVTGLEGRRALAWALRIEEEIRRYSAEIGKKRKDLIQELEAPESRVPPQPTIGESDGA